MNPQFLVWLTQSRLASVGSTTVDLSAVLFSSFSDCSTYLTCLSLPSAELIVTPPGQDFMFGGVQQRALAMVCESTMFPAFVCIL